MKEKFVRFLKSNFIIWAFWAVTLIIELTGVCVTSGRFMIRAPFMFLSLMAIFTAVLFCIKNPKGRYWCAFTLMLVFFVLDLVFIVVYEMTGSTFDFSMLKLRNDAMAIVESVPINFVYVLVCGVSISAYLVFARYYLRFAPAPTRVMHRAIVAAIMVAVLVLHGGMAYLENRSVNPADLSYKLYSGSDGTYYDRGIIGNFVDELYKGAFFSKVPLGDEEELENYIYSSQSKPSRYHGAAEDYNVVTILAESLEWFAFTADLSDAGLTDAFPGGFGSYGIGEKELRELYPNLYRLYDTAVVGLNHHAREKTDISENQSIIGNYPTDCLINYDYPKNTVPYSLPNILKTLYGVESNSFHNGDYEFYNRSTLHENALGFEKYTAREQMAEKEGFTDYYAQNSDRNLDSEMISACKDEMFPSDRRFNTFIISITTHGQYEYRRNLEPYYKKFAEYGLIPSGDVDSMHDIFLYYTAMALDFDNALGIMFDHLENTKYPDGTSLLDKTIIVVYGDHNAYYQALSPNVKNLFLDDNNDRNYTDLFRVPLMVYVGGGVSESMPAEDRLVRKFTTTTDIIPTVLDLLGINCYDSIYYGHNLFDSEESVIYSRAYDVFITDKLYFSSINNIKFATPDADDAYIEAVAQKALTLLEKTSHVNRIFYYDFLSGARGETFNTKLKELNS